MAKTMKILAINPGSTSTKIALYEDDKELFKTNIEHSADELAKYPNVASQYDMRKDAILAYLKSNNFDPSTLDAIAARGGPIPYLKGGAYRVNDAMTAMLKSKEVPEHASNLAGLIAYEITKPLGKNAYIYDAISADDFADIARISGMPALPRQSLCHVLNMRAVARKTAAEMGKPYSSLNLIVAHLGGGITVSVHRDGKMEDIVSDDEGPFSPERAGRVPCRALIDLCYSGKYDFGTMKKMLRGKGGLVAYLGTSNCIEVEKRIDAGDAQAKLILEAMAYQIAKSIGDLATVVNGKVDAIVLTGGIAYSKLVTGWISDRVSFIAPVKLVPGENELESLALGILRVLRGDEKANEYVVLK
ncbi:MAG: butyrate kinase [Treponemataceae bacterium]